MANGVPLVALTLNLTPLEVLRMYPELLYDGPGATLLDPHHQDVGEPVLQHLHLTETVVRQHPEQEGGDGA